MGFLILNSGQSHQCKRREANTQTLEAISPEEFYKSTGIWHRSAPGDGD